MVLGRPHVRKCRTNDRQRPMIVRDALAWLASGAFVVLAVGCSADGAATTGSVATHTAAPSGARIVFTAPMPSSGTIGIGAGSVWVIDRKGGDAADPDRAALLQIDPENGSVRQRIDGVIGASIAVTDNDVWVASAATDRLIRVSVNGGQIDLIPTAPPEVDDVYPYGVVAANGSLWVANHHAGTIARIDPRTNSIVDTVAWGAPGGGGPTHLAADGASVWVTSVRTMDLAEIDATSGEITRRYDLAPVGACGGLAADAGSIWSTSGFDRPFDCWQPEHWGVSRVDRATGAVSRIDVAGRPVDVRVAFGSVWVLTDEPVTELLRLDPATSAVTGRVALPLRPDYANPLAVGLGAIWVRVIADDGNADGALLKLEPES